MRVSGGMIVRVRGGRTFMSNSNYGYTLCVGIVREWITMRLGITQRGIDVLHYTKFKNQTFVIECVIKCQLLAHWSYTHLVLSCRL